MLSKNQSKENLVPCKIFLIGTPTNGRRFEKSHAGIDRQSKMKMEKIVSQMEKSDTLPTVFNPLYEKKQLIKKIGAKRIEEVKVTKIDNEEKAAE